MSADKKESAVEIDGQSPGEYLKAAREAKGHSLDEIARVTKISKRLLEALETDQLEILPAPAFTRGFIKAYCRFVKIDPEVAVTEYSKRYDRLRSKEEDWGGSQHTPGPGKLLIPMIVIVAIVLAVIFFFLQKGKESEGTREPELGRQGAEFHDEGAPHGDPGIEGAPRDISLPDPNDRADQPERLGEDAAHHDGDHIDEQLE